MSVAYLKALVSCWEKQLEEAQKQKAQDFGKTAEQLWGFMHKSYREIYLEEGSEFSFPSADNQGPYYKPRLYKCREFVNVVLPFVHAKVPHRLVSPRRPPLPSELLALSQMAWPAGQDIPPELVLLQGISRAQGQANIREQIVSWFLQWYLNYIVDEYGAKREQRTCIQEALVKGRGIVWHELTDGPTGLLPGSYFDTVDGLFCDPEAKQWRDCGYIFRERNWPSWRLADLYGNEELDAEKIRSAAEEGDGKSVTRSGSGVQPTAQRDRDSCRWFEVWSRIGMGERLHSAADTLRDGEHARLDAIQAVEPHVHLAILPGLDYPLNLTPALWENGDTEELARALKWPIAFFEDKANPFPCTPLDIYPNTQDPWATSPLLAGLSLQIFLDHLYGFLMSRVRVTSRDIIITAKVLEEAVNEAIKSGCDQIVVPAETQQVAEMQNLVHILQFPPVQEDIWKVLLQTERAFEQATGMDPLLYGGEGQRQMRSAREAGVREAHVTNRPNDYADAVEEWNSQVAKAEGQMTRLYIGPASVAPLFREPIPSGETEMGPATTLWSALVNTDDPADAVADLHYTVEAGSGRRKNRQAQLDNLQDLLRTLGPVIQAFAQSGVVQPWNELVDILGDADVYGIPLGRLKLPLMAMQESEEGEEEGAA